jgi:NhaP-type Na+/H+ or K+/H+ antiporter
MTDALIITSVGLLIFLAHLFAALFEKTRIPDVLSLVFIGLILGPVTGVAGPEAFGRIGHVFTMVALVIILFEGGLGLNITVLQRSMVRATRLTLVNLLGAIAALTLLSVYLFGLTVLEGLLLGSILSATAPAVVLPMVSRLPFSKGTRTTLILESIFGEGLCIVLTLAFLQAILSAEISPSLILGEVIASFALAAILGAGAAFFWSKLLNQVRQLENSTFTTPAFVFIIFGFTELLGYNGPIAAFAFGIVLGNIKRLDISTLEDGETPQLFGLNKMEKAFFGEVVFLLKTFFFVYIGLSARFTDLSFVYFGLVITAVIFIMRVPLVSLAMDKKCTCREAPLVAALAPRGLAAAVLATILLQTGLEKSAFMNDLVYIVITMSIIATTIFTFLIERTPLGRLGELLFSNFAPVQKESPKTEEKEKS